MNVFMADFKSDILNNIIRHFTVRGEKQIDLMALPTGYDLTTYMAFEEITLISNSPSPKLIEENDLSRDMEYTAIPLYKIGIKKI